MSEPLARLRLYPEPGTRYVRVLVWPTRAAMCQHLRTELGMRGLRHTQGTCTGVETWLVRPRWTRKTGVVAEVNLYRGALGMEIVTHELFHATIAYGRRISFDWSRFGADDSVNQDEERLTYVHGRLCAAFVRAAERLRLYDPDRWRRPARAA